MIRYMVVGVKLPKSDKRTFCLIWAAYHMGLAIFAPCGSRRFDVRLLRASTLALRANHQKSLRPLEGK